MALSYPARSYVANAVAGTLSSALTSSSTSFTSSTSLASWSDVTGGTLSGQLVVAVEYGTANEEKILCTYSAGNFNIIQRNYNSETSFPYTTTSHPSASTFVLVWSSTEAAEAQAAIQSVKQLLLNTGTSQTPATITDTSTSNNGSSKFAAAADHSHAISVTGLQGPQGATGAAGATGPQGATGAQGAQGASGAIATADAKTSTTALTINTTTYATSGNILPTAVNPSGNFTNYRYSIIAKTLNSAASATLSLTLQLLYRQAGSSGAWTVATAAFGGGGANATQTAYNFSYEGLVALSPTVDYEFQIGALTTTGTIQVDRWSLLVEGLN